MFKKTFHFPLIYFVVSVVYQFIFHGNVDWFRNIIVCGFIYFIVLFTKWAGIRHKWKNNAS
ncbi:hypothetical protein [Metabacillus malikii]|uniref:Bacteriocin immunity protein n=1 Tax=Metabacillus malikii TaxID=1504265 RepID=A0ABT9ZBL9_9BACI|nr:hypothetical protein [Metabacillus malikii]MDQ0229309.1 hypothetical protein [Metabacillus malikii]